MIRPKIRDIALAILLCVVCLIVWFLLRTDDGEVVVADSTRGTLGLSEAESLPPVPAWEDESETTSNEPEDESKGEEEFLATDYEPLDKWLNERFEIDFKHMSPDLIFEQVPLNDIYYETLALPEDAPAFHLASGDISRRELLERIADFWELDMSLVVDDSGNPTAVRVLSPGFYQ